MTDGPVSQRQQQRIYGALLVVSLAIVVAAIGLGVARYRHDARLARSGTLAMATVTETHLNGRGPSTITVTFTTPDGAEHRGSYLVVDPGHARPGSTVKIRYSPADPTDVRPSGGSYADLLLPLALLAASIFPAVAGAYGLRRHRGLPA